MSAYSTQKLPKTVYSTIDFLFFQYAFTSHKHTTKEMRTHTHARTYVRTQTHTQKKADITPHLHHSSVAVLSSSDSPPRPARPTPPRAPPASRPGASASPSGTPAPVAGWPVSPTSGGRRRLQGEALGESFHLCVLARIH